MPRGEEPEPSGVTEALPEAVELSAENTARTRTEAGGQSLLAEDHGVGARAAGENEGAHREGRPPQGEEQTDKPAVRITGAQTIVRRSPTRSAIAPPTTPPENCRVS